MLPHAGPQLAGCAQALVDRPDMVRKQINFKRLVLTDFKIDIPRLAKKKVLSAALEESGALLYLVRVCCCWRKQVVQRHRACSGLCGHILRYVALLVPDLAGACGAVRMAVEPMARLDRDQGSGVSKKSGKCFGKARPNSAACGTYADVIEKFNNSAWGRKLAKRASKAAMTDFDRYKATVSKVKRAKSVREAYHKLAGKEAKSAYA